MHTFELVKLSKDHLEKIQKYSSLLDNAYKISSAYDKVPDYIAAISSGISNSMSSASASIKNRSDSVKNITASISPREMFKNIEGMHDCLTEIERSETNEIDDGRKAVDALQEFSINYESYIASYNPTDAPPLVFSAKNLANHLDKLISRYKFILSNIESKNEQKENIAELSLYISNITGLRDFADKLNAISDLYETLAELLGIDITDTPLIIDQIESGSLWSKLFGDSRVIGLMIDLMRSCAEFMHRNYTTEGKITSLPSKLESLNKIIDLSGRLSDQGIDTSEVNEEIRRAAVSITKDLNKLIERQPKIEINGKSQSIADEFLKAISDESWLKPRISHDENQDPPLSLPQPEN